jgi:hypothetical protein
MVTYLTSGLPAFAFVALAIIAVGGGLVFYALRIKGDVHAEFSHGKTTLRIDARDRRNTRSPRIAKPAPNAKASRTLF